MLKHPGLDLLVAPATSGKPHRVIITPGGIGNAVARNKIRRRLKAIITQAEKFKHVDVIIFVKKAGINLSYDQLKKLIG